MSHRHLVLAYVVTWLIQLGYVGYLALTWRALKKAEREFPTYEEPAE